MQHAIRVHVVQPQGHLHEPVQDLRLGEGPSPLGCLGYLIAQVTPVAVRHHDA